MPFEEDGKDPSIWSFDRDHHEYMLRMFKGLNGTCQKPVALIIYIMVMFLTKRKTLFQTRRMWSVGTAHAPTSEKMIWLFTLLSLGG